MPDYSKIEQASPEWFKIRLGKVTASRIADVMARTKTGASASRKNYMAQLLAERLSGQVADSFKSAAMEWGTQTEAEARATYSFLRNEPVDEIAFIDHPCIQGTGCSPDGLVGQNGMLEIKCPNTATHLEFLETGKIEGKYLKQIQWQMNCADRTWCDFVSYDPRLPKECSIKIKRVDFEAELSIEIEKAVKAFIAELQQRERELRARYFKQEET